MKNKKFLLLTSCFLVFSSCTPGGKEKLVMSDITADDAAIRWTAVEGASKYSVVVNNDAAVEVTVPQYDFSSEEGIYEVKVTAIAGDSKHSDSDAKTFSYETKKTSLASVDSTGANITWGEYVGKGIEVKTVDATAYTAVVGTSYTVTKSDLYIVRAAPGYKDNKYYVEDDAGKKGILVSLEADDVVALEDGTAETDIDLAEKYTVKTYSTDWVDTSASINLDGSTNKGISDGKCVKLHFWHNSQWYKYTTALNLDKSYDTFSFMVKGGVNTSASLTFEITDHIMIGSIDLAGVYISYMVEPTVQEWTKYTVSLDDPNWQVAYNNAKYSFSQIQPMIASSGYTIKSLADMMPFFSKFSLRVRGTKDEKYTDCYSWFDDVVISNVGATSKAETPIVVGENYVIESDAFKGTAKFVNDGTGTLSIKLKSDGSSVQLPITHAVVEGKLHMVCTATDFDFDATFVGANNGKSFVLDTVSGTASNAFEKFKAEEYVLFDDFESYTETGTGYDNNHKNDPKQVTGLRSAYYADWYNTSNQYAVSLVGDSNWKLMGSTDYFSLDTTNGRNGGKCAKFKESSGGAMRYTNRDILFGDGEAFYGTTFSIWAKGATNLDVKLKIRVFTVSKLDKSNHVSDGVSVMKQVTITKNSDWTEYTVTLKPNTAYYGFTLTAVNGSSAAYPLLDDISIYGSISPWGN